MTSVARSDPDGHREYPDVSEHVVWTKAQCIRHRVRELRERQGWSQPSLAGRLEEVGALHLADHRLVSEIETGKRQVSAEEVDQLALALRARPVDLEVPDDDAKDEHGRRIRVAVTATVTMTPRQARAWKTGVGGPPDGELLAYLSSLPAEERERMRRQSELAGRRMFADSLLNELPPPVDPGDVPDDVLRDGPHYLSQGDPRKGAPR